MKQKVAFFIHCYPPAIGGSEKLAGMLKDLIDSSYRVEVFTGKGTTLDSYKTFSDFLENTDDNIYRLDTNFFIQRLANKILPRFIKKYGIISHYYFGPFLRYSRQEVSLVKDCNLIIGFAMPTKTFIDAYYFANKFRKHLILIPTYHDVRYYNHSPWFLKALKYSCQIICLSDLEKKQLLRNYRISSDKIKILTFCPYTKKEIYSQNSTIKFRRHSSRIPTVGYVGQISTRKNLYSAFAAILKNGINVVFAGARTNSSVEIEKHFQSYTRKGQLKIYYNFPENNKTKIFKSFDIFINPSIEESLSIVNFESIFHGIPILVDRASAFSDILSPYDPQFIYQTISEVPSLIRQCFQDNSISIHARKQFRLFSLYNLDNFKNKFLQILSFYNK